MEGDDARENGGGVPRTDVRSPRTPDSVVRVVAAAARDVGRDGGDVEPDGHAGAGTGAGPRGRIGTLLDPASARIIAAALTGGAVDGRALDAACTSLADDPRALLRLDAMVKRAMRALVEDDAVAGEVLPLERASAIAAVHAAMLRATLRRQDGGDVVYERFANAVAEVAAGADYQDACQRAADAMAQLADMPAAAVYVPGPEYARMVRAARDSSLAMLAPGEEGAGGRRELDTPASIRIDRGLFADVVAGDRPLFLSQQGPIDALPPTERAAHTLVAVPMRDPIGRPVGLLVALDERTRELDVTAVESIRRLAEVVAGVLALAAIVRRSNSALATLPALAEVAHADDSDVTAQLEALARIAAEATESDSAVIRVHDASGRFLETRAVTSTRGDAVADIIGTRTIISSEVPGGGTTTPARDPAEVGLEQHEIVGIDEPPDTWSSAGRRILVELGARSVATWPIDSQYGRRAVLYVVRRTARPFDEADRACCRIVIAHAQHVIDRHVSQQQTARAIDAARSAVRLLGEALVAGVRTERTLRFVPRLFHEMFASRGVRIWRRDRSGVLTLIAGAGSVDPTSGASEALLQGLERPLLLELDTRSHPHVAAVAFDEYGGGRIGVEFELLGDGTLGVEEQRLAVDVAARIQEAMWSAGQAAAQELQLDRVRALQEIVATAHEALSEQHVFDTVLGQVPDLYGASGSAAFVVEANGSLSLRGSVDIPAAIVEGIESVRAWVPEATGGERAIVLAISRAASDERIGEELRDAVLREGMGDHAAVVVPLTGREQTIGLLVVTFSDGLPAEFEGESVTGRGGTLASFGRHIGSAVLNARAFERERHLRTRTDELLDAERENSRQVRALHEVSRAFANSLSFEETLRAVVEAMADRLDVDAVWIRTRDDRGDLMLLRAFHASHPELSVALERMVAAPEQRDDPITSEVLGSRRAVLVLDPDDEQWGRSEVLTRLQPFLGRGSTLAVLPVMRPGGQSEDVMGTLTMLSINPEHALTYDKVDIASSVTDQAALALDNARLYEQQKSFAEIIQESLLPRRLPDIPSIDYGVLYRSAVVGGDAPQIGGDFYDFLELEDGRLAMALGDVTGKGVQAAADTAMTKYVFRSLAREHPNPGNFLRYANEVVCDEISSGKFVTLFYAVIDPAKGTFLCGNAGHPEPKLLFPGGTRLASGEVIPEGEVRIDSLGMEGLALGILQDQDYEQREYEFPPGASLIVYTDGVVEARREGRLYGQFRLERRITDEAGGGAGQIAYSIYEDCHAYAEHGLNDDVAIVVVRNMP